MGLRINNNIAALNSYNNLSRTDKAVSSSLEKLSSGLRINKAADDAAGLVISEGLRSQISGLTVAARNAQDGVNVMQSADGALGTTSNILQRMRDLAVQSANDTNSTESRAAIQKEVVQLKQELDRLAQNTSFNGVPLLDGTFTTKQFQVGAGSGGSDVITAGIQGGASASKLPFTASTVTTAGNFTFAQADDSGASGVGAISITTGTIATTSSSGATASALNSDTAFASQFVASTDAAGNLVVSSKNGNRAAVTVTASGGGAGLTAGTAVVGTTAGGGFDTTGLSLSSIDLSTKAGANSALTALTTALTKVSGARADIGALQNRFEYAINNINVSIENLTASESAIRDTDMAKEMTKFTKNQILSQAGTSMLAQANSSTQNILTLLRG